MHLEKNETIEPIDPPCPSTQPPDPHLEPGQIPDAPGLEFLVAQAEAQAAFRVYDNQGLLRLCAATGSAGSVGRRLKKHWGFDFDLPEWRKRVEAMAAIVPSLPSSKLHQIPTSNRPLRDLTDDTIAALRDANVPPTLFVRHNRLVSLTQDESGGSSIRTLDESALRIHLSRIADFWKLNSQQEARHTNPSREVCQSILAGDARNWKLPHLAGITEIPTFRPDGTLITKPGYDVDTQLVYSPSGIRLGPIPDDPSIEDVNSALAVLDDVFCDFPFEDDSSRANLYGLLLTAILRPAIKGCTPLALIDAPDKGTGKTLLASTVCLIITGRNAGMQTYPTEEAELQKCIAASLRSGSQFVIFDNVDRPLDSGSLASVLTAEEYKARILGVTLTETFPNQATWMVTGNNIRVAGDIPRRCYHIRLDAKKAKAFIGRKFRHANLGEHVREQRPEILRALLVIAMTWFANRKPPLADEAQILGGFEPWHRTIGGVLRYVGINGFLANQQPLVDSDNTESQWHAFLLKFQDSRGDKANDLFTARDFVDALKGNHQLREILPDSLGELDLTNPTKAARLIGSSLTAQRDRRRGEGAHELRIYRSDIAHRVTKSCQYRILGQAEDGKSLDKEYLAGYGRA